MARRTARRPLVALALAAALLGAACSGDDEPEASQGTGTTLTPIATTVPPTTTSTTTAPETTAPPPTGNTRPPTDSPEQLAALRDAYRQGYEQTCRAIFGLSPSGRMEDPEDEGTYYTLADCMADLDETTGEVYSDIQDAFDGGIDDASFTAESFTFSGSLCSETGRCWSN